MPTTTDRKFLAGYDDSTVGDATNIKRLGIRQRVFGELVVLATPLIRHYHSDLYHDVHWLDTWVNGPTTFFFGADDCGTAIGTDEALVRQARKSVWRVELTHENESWFLRIEAVEGR